VSFEFFYRVTAGSYRQSLCSNGAGAADVVCRIAYNQNLITAQIFL